MPAADPGKEPDLRLAPVFLLGPARSGTSLLYKLLCLHPDVAYISNYVARYPGVPSVARLNRFAAGRPEQQRRVWFGEGGTNAYVYGRRRPLGERLFPMPVEGEPVFRRAGAPPDADPSPDRLPAVASRLAASVGAVVRSSGARVFVNKRIANIYRVGLLRAAFPSARFVALVRDGRAVALSLSRVDWWPTSTVVGYGGTPERWAAEGGDPWELCARNWVDELAAMEAGLDGVEDDRILRLRYEELIDDPPAQLDRIGRFAALPPAEGWEARLRGLSFPDRNETWREALDATPLGTITDLQAPTLEAYGYGR